MSIFSRRSRTASLTIEDDAVRYVRLKSLDPLVVEAAEEIVLPPNTIVDGKIVDAETLTVLLEGVLKDWGIAKRDVRFLAPDTYVLIRKVSYPDDVQLDELKGHFFIEIGSTIYLPFDDPVFDVVPYTPAVQGHEAILIASKESVLNGYEDVLKAVKLDPVACDISPLALYRLAHRLFAYDGSEHVMLADLHAGRLTVSIFHNYYPLFMRPVDLDQAADLTISGIAAAASSTVTPMSVVMELEKLMNFYRYNMLNGAASITHLLVNGDFEGMDELLALARDRFSVKAQVLAGEPLRLPDGQALDPSFNRTVGLALKEVT
ncbi:hypothetical protein NCCP2222_03710 [Sporosarcina sp. NCCP-2222]|uniref:type IV pilus biogenesis protein PilM n=1 Tax=Sporosarcina sp. NCCP-2222 TaxID=2935073 RepID=UPI0020830D87|nr:pilus assembly protein PilM [Sporosarcina sp. NCCP-2222]GKV54424.1 hypothetical protein NCCP2222_03710 [Sporosarcina sp. NCCP-2222]